MPYVSQIFRQSNKLRNTNTSNLVKIDHPVLAHWFSSSSRSFVANGDHFPKLPQCGSVAGKGHGANKSSVGFLTSSQRNNSLDVSTLGMQKKLDARATSFMFNRLISCPQMQPRKCFSTSSDLPPHQEVGMPSLSPTMTEGNIARWLKKEGDKVSPGEVLCEIETDKATVEMECMEEGYLAKILKGAGSTGIQVGEVIAITVEEESDIGNFKDYTPSTSDATQKPARKEPSPSREAAQETASPAPTSSNPNLPPHQEVGMPSLSPTMTEGNIARWLKKEGDKVSPGEVLCEVETDKATVEMECMEEGYLAKILKGDGSSGIQVGEVIAITVEEEDDIAKFKDYTPSTSDAGQKPAPKEPSRSNEAAQEPVTASPKPRTTSRTGSRIFASPLARKLAEQHNVSLSSIEGTGPDGRIVKADIEEYLASPRKEAPATGRGVETAPVGAINYVDIPHSQIRKVTASRLLLSKQTIPHYYLTVDTCVDKLIELRVLLNSLVEASGGKKISINDLVIKAAALALRKVPSVNSSWTNDYIRQYHNVNVNVAVQTENGLYVPVIRDADKKGLSTISEEVKHVAQKAKENTLKPEDYEGGTFTVSNLGGPFGVKQFCAIVNPPQAAILAVGSAEKRVVPGLGTDQFKFASFMSVTLSCDHRVIDGAIGAEWLKAFKGYIENPESMML